jgi:exopolyphosphatase/guanosine-5'-triphosphate,3'-diphosphate pyrophosphatase
MLGDPEFRTQLVALRLAVLLHHARTAVALPRIGLTVNRRIRFALPSRWLQAHPLTAHLVDKERSQWTALGYGWSPATGN